MIKTLLLLNKKSMRCEIDKNVNIQWTRFIYWGSTVIL